MTKPVSAPSAKPATTLSVVSPSSQAKHPAGTLTRSQFEALAPAKQSAHFSAGGKLVEDNAPAPVQTQPGKDTIIKSAYDRLTAIEKSSFMASGGKVVFDMPVRMTGPDFNGMTHAEKSAFSVAGGKLFEGSGPPVWRAAVLTHQQWQALDVVGMNEFFRHGGKLAN